MEVTVLASRFPTEAHQGYIPRKVTSRRDPHFSAKMKLYSTNVTPGPVPDLLGKPQPGGTSRV
jgi:hypothetical protein